MLVLVHYLFEYNAMKLYILASNVSGLIRTIARILNERDY